MSKQTSVVELPNAHAENPVGKSVAVNRKRGRPAKQTRAKVDETAETASTSAEHSCGKSSAAKQGRRTKPMSTTESKAFTLEELQKEDGGWFTIKPAMTIAALCWDRYSYHRCVDCRMRALPNAEGGYGCAQHPAAKTEEIYRLRILLRQDYLNMWVNAFADVAELLVGVSVEEFGAFDDAGRKRIAWGIRGMKCNMTIGKTVGEMYTNYTVKRLEFAGYLPWTLMRTRLVASLEVSTGVAKRLNSRTLFGVCIPKRL